MNRSLGLNCELIVKERWRDYGGRLEDWKAGGLDKEISPNLPTFHSSSIMTDYGTQSPLGLKCGQFVG